MITSVPIVSDPARANIYFILANAFAPPTTLDANMSGLLGALELPKPMQILARDLATSWEQCANDLEALGVVYARLFLGPFEVLAAPYASLYLDRSQRLMGQVSMEVTRRYCEAGLVVRSGQKDAPDHVTRELEYMYFLGFRAVETRETIWTTRMRRFWLDHLGRWLPQFARDVQKTDRHTFYNALANFVEAFCISEQEHWSLNQ